MAMGSSSGNNASSSVGAVLPASVGTNPLAGNSYKVSPISNQSTIYKFGDTSFTCTTTTENPVSTYNTKAYIFEEETVYNYSYNVVTKSIYAVCNQRYLIYKNSEKEERINGNPVFTSEEDMKQFFISLFKKINEIRGYSQTDAELEAGAKKSINQCCYDSTHTLIDGYTDYSFTTDHTAEQSTKMIQARNLSRSCNSKTVNCYAYDFDASNNLKLATQGNLPADIKLGGIWNGIYNFSAVITNNSVNAGTIKITAELVLDPNNSLNSYAFVPSITIGTGAAAQYFKITSASDNAIFGVLQTCTGSGTAASPFVYTDVKAATIKLENSTTASGTTVTIKMPNHHGEYDTLGSFVIPYNNTILDAYYTTYTKQ